MNDNLKVWNSLSQPPPSALKKITGGRMSGKTDINPQWRYKAMTEQFGVIGIGWKFTKDKEWTEQGANNEVMAFVDVSVYIRDGEGKWSEPIPGSGGWTLVISEDKGYYNDDDAFKKATTDALGTAMKMLGVGADVYMGKWDGAKYKDTATPPPPAGLAEGQPGQGGKKKPPFVYATALAEYAKLCDKADTLGIPHSALAKTEEEAREQFRTILANIKAAEEAS